MARQVTLGFLLLALVPLTVCVKQRYIDYPASYDKTDINGILNNRDLLRVYVDCLMDRGDCSPQGQTLKDIIPMAVDDNCGRCTPEQSYLQTKVKRFFLRSQVPGDRKNWDDIIAKYKVDVNKLG